MSTSRMILIKLTVEFEGDWPGDEAACDAALRHVPNGIIDLGDDRALIIRSMSAKVLSPCEPN